jgi:hypothetical protein
MIACGKIPAVRLGLTDRGDIRVAEAALWEFGVGGPRPIVMMMGSVVTEVETVVTGADQGRSPVVSNRGLRAGKRSG